MIRLPINDISFIIVIFFTFLFLGGIAKSENLQNVLQNLERLEKDIQDLQKEIYREKDSITASTINPSEGIDRNLAAFDIRISDIENEVRQLTTYVEEYVFRIDELSDKIDDILLEQRSNIILSDNNSTDSLEENKNDQSADESQDSFNDNEEQTLGSLIISGDEAIEEKVGESFGNDILPEGSPEEQYQFAFGLLRSQKFDEAKRAFEIFIDKNETHNLAGSANYWIGEIIFLQGNYKEAALTFAEGYQKYPESKKVADTLLKLSISLLKINKNEQACITLNELINNYPESRLIDRANMELKSSNCP